MKDIPLPAASLMVDALNAARPGMGDIDAGELFALFAFAQAQRFARVTGRMVEITIGKDWACIANHGANGDFAMNPGWSDGDPRIDVRGSSFAAAWEEFCGYWPEAGRF